MGDGLRHAFQQHQTAGKPALDVVRGAIAHLAQVALEIVANGVALQVIVVSVNRAKVAITTSDAASNILWLNLRRLDMKATIFFVLDQGGNPGLAEHPLHYQSVGVCR